MQTQLHQRLLELTPTASAELKAIWQSCVSAVPSPDDPPSKMTAIVEQYLILVTCRDEKQQVELVERFRGEGRGCKPLLT